MEKIFRVQAENLAHFIPLTKTISLESCFVILKYHSTSYSLLIVIVCLFLVILVVSTLALSFLLEEIFNLEFAYTVTMI